jgi:hypothetical protein
VIPVQTTYLRPRSGIILLTLVPILMVMFLSDRANIDSTLKWIYASMLLVPVGMYIFITNTYIELDNEGITHKNPCRTKTILWSKVARSYFKIVSTGKSSKRMWYFEGNNKERLRFTTRLYSRKALRSIAEALVIKCPEARIEQKIINIAEGEFPWYIF